MSIPASQIVQVNPRVLASGGTDLEFNALLLSRTPTIPTDTALQFANASDVGEYFGFESEEYTLATVYFLGYNNSFVKPRKLLVSRRVDTDVAAFIRGGAVTDTVAELQNITAGSLTLSLSNFQTELTGLDFSSIVTYSDAAVILQAAINAVSAGGTPWTNASVAYSSLFNAYTITNGDTGDTSNVAFAEGDVAERVKLTSSTGAVLSQGFGGMSEALQMEMLTDRTQNWVNLCLAWMPDEEEVLGFGQWASSKGIDYLFIYADNSPSLLQSDNQDTIAYAVKQANLGSIAGCYSDTRYPMFLAGIGASIDWNRQNGLPTAAFKAQQGLEATVTRGTDALNLLAQGMNFMGDYATRNDNFVFNYAGQMFGDYKWIDTYWGAVWLKNAIQVACMNGFSLAPRVPYTERGYTLIRAWLQDPVNRALVNAVIDPGVVLSETQKAQIQQEAGQAIADEVEQTGYHITVKDPGAQARVERESPQVGIWYTYGGSVNRLDVPVTVLT